MPWWAAPTSEPASSAVRRAIKGATGCRSNAEPPSLQERIMGCCNEPVTTLTGLPADPTQHVNYERGMVLGVDDFTQEFAYLAGRDQWLARDALGYGTLSGLRIQFENDGSDGPRLHVAAGSALVPSGKLVCVAADQCAVLNRWLAKP